MELREQVAGKDYESLYAAKVISINIEATKPVQVERTIQGQTYNVDCYVTKAVKDLYLLGNLNINDKVVVAFLESDPQKAIIIAKIII